MRLNQLDLNLFLVFEIVYQQRNLTRAAEILNITQPAVSNALARLRDKLNDPLFVRTTAGMTPTPLADNIIGRVREGLQMLHTSATEGNVFDPATSNQIFRISMNDITESMVLPWLVERLQRVAPYVGLECHYIARADIERELTAGTLDFAIDIPQVTSNQVCHDTLIKQHSVCVVRHDHPIIGDTLTLDEYLALDHIQVSSRRKGESYDDIALNRLGYKRHVRMRVQHHLVSPLLVELTDMALTIPASIAKKYNLKILELPYELPPVQMNLFWHKRADHDNANLWMRGLLQEVKSEG
ncbi:LysR family transcriptional regulator [Colwellia sp. 20A7]|uniref:LysR family transcriptional regulator n=1 Tax=Colwellia sp. 20A7 TaxID=2689569 RepID=UPI001358A5B1|nr:LysR family transcriptional regulator [Colwellia sp. 20A7]